MEESDIFLKPLLSCKVRDKKFQLLLKACSEQQAFTNNPDNKIRDFIAFVNSRLNELSDRNAGIQLLKIFLSQCPDRVFFENCVNWMTQCLKAVVNSQTEDEAYSALEMLLNMCHGFQELTKSVTGTIIPKLLEQVLKSGKSVAALKCLQIILHHYPGPCKMRMKSVETFLLKFLDEEDKLLVEYAARCISYLPLLLSSRNDDGNKWAVLQTELCATANTQIYELFENVHEAVIPPALIELSAGYQLTSVSQDNPVIAYHKLATRIINIMTFLEGIVGGDLERVKAVRFDILVALAYRVFAVNSKMVSLGHSMEHVALATVLPDIHVAVFNMLKALVSCCPGGLIKFGPLFCKLVVQTLKWTSVTSGYGVERPYRNLREAAYKFLECWILRESAASCAELVADELVSLMLKDVFQKREIVTLQFQNKGQSSKQRLPQRRQKLADPKVNAGPCESALLVLCALVQTSGSLLKPSLHMSLQEVTISLLMDIRRSSGCEDFSVPFCVPGCRLQLYRLLLVLTLHPHPRWPPPTQFALSLLSWGQHDSSLEVAGFCNLAVACTRQMVHPSQSSHQFPLSVNEMRASVGLCDLKPVQGLQKTIPKRQSCTGNEEIGAEANFTTPNNKQSVNNSIEIQDLFQSQNSGKSTKKKSRASTSEVAMNGSDGPQIPFSSKVQEKKLQSSTSETSSTAIENVSNSNKSRKKKRHSIDELNMGINRKVSRRSGDDWEITEVSQIKKNVSKENKISKSVDISEYFMKRKRNLDCSPGDERNKVKKVDDPSFKSNLMDSPKSCDVEESLESEETSLKSSKKQLSNKIDEKSPKPSEGKSPSKLEEKETSKSIQKELLSQSSSDLFTSLEDNNLPGLSNTLSSQVIGTNPAMIDDIQNTETEVIDLVDETPKNEIGPRKDTEEVIIINESDVENEDENSEQKGKHETTLHTDQKIINEKEENEMHERNEKEQDEKHEDNESTRGKSPLTVKTDSNRYNLRKERLNTPVKVRKNDSGGLKSNSGKNKLDSASSLSGEVTLNSQSSTDPHNKEQTAVKKSSGPLTNKSGEEKLKPLSPVVELTISSDSEPEQLKTESGAFRRITRNLPKRSSTPHRSSEQRLDIEEISSYQDSGTSKILSEISQLEEESTSAIADPSVELAESDESMNLVLRIDSDRESVEIQDITNEMTEQTKVNDKGKVELETFQDKECVSSKPNPSKNNKDSTTSDREMEEVSAGMDAVADSPDVAVEDKETAVRKSNEEAVEEGSDSAEEDVLKTFVDVVSPKSE